MRCILSLLTVLLLFACAPSPTTMLGDKPTGNVPEGTMSQGEVLMLFTDRTVESVTLGKRRVSLSYYDPSGEIRQLRDGMRRSGFWRVNSNGRICLKMEGGEEKCRVMVRETDGSYRKYIIKKNGKHKPVVGYRSFEPGNPRNL